MRALSLLAALLAAASLSAPQAAAQAGPGERRPPADTIRFGATRPAAGDSIVMAEYDEADARDEDGVAEDGAVEDDTVPAPRRDGPYARAADTGPFSVQSSGETAERPARGEAVWVQGGAARPAAADTARAAAGQRTTAAPAAARDTAGGRRTSAAQTAAASSTTASRPAASTGANQPNRGGGTAAATSGRAGSTTSSAAARPRAHTVAAGETFFAIARRYGVTAAQMRAVNPGVEMDRLEVGDVLRLPAGARDSRAGAAPPASNAPRPRTGTQPAGNAARTHTVAAGETLFGLARRYGVTVDAIRRANDMETDQVRTGQRLRIPPAP